MYCTTEEVRDLTGLSTSEINDDKLYSLIERAVVRLNGQINYRVSDEQVLWVSNEKKNSLNGTNTTFYTRTCPIGDRNNDGEVTASDLYVYSLDSTSTRTELTVSSIDDDEIGKFSLSSAPSSDVSVYVSYNVAPLEEETPHALIKQACMELTAALAYSRVQDGSVRSFALGNFRITRDNSQYADYMSQYYCTIKQIVATQLSEFVAESEDD